jgi:hypothetical protein
MDTILPPRLGHSCQAGTLVSDVILCDVHSEPTKCCLFVEFLMLYAEVSNLLLRSLAISYIVSHLPKSSYSLEVMPFDNAKSTKEEAQAPLSPVEPLAEFPLNPFPIHHPNGLDLAIIHLQEEEEALTAMKELGVTILDTRDLEKHQPFKGESLDFEGFQIDDADLSEKDDEFFKKNNNAVSLSVQFAAGC